MNNMLSSLYLVVLLFSVSQGADFFEALYRLNCYHSEQKGCNTEFTDAHPNLAWSYNNLTKADTFFFLFTKQNPDVPELLHKCGGDVPPDTTFNPNCRTEIFLPGFASGICNLAIYRELKNERLKSGCYNVILLDWTWGNFPDFVESNNNMKIVAKQLAIVIRNLKARFNLSAEHFIVSGHSAAAHMAGFVGQDEPVGVIMGLDPAGGSFTKDMPLDERLDATDAPCVQVLHTNAGQCIPTYLGVNFTCGDIDVWFNGGIVQLSCYPDTLKALIKQDFLFGLLSLLPSLCYHVQVLQYYKASMNPTDCQFIGIECKSQKAFNRGKCRRCKENGPQCFSVGAYGCDCRTNDEHKNLYLRTGLLCPYCDNIGVNTSSVTCGITPPSE